MILSNVAETAVRTDEGIAMVVFMGVFFVLYLVVFGLAIAGYVFQSLGMHRIAQRRGIRNPWLAWIPVANSWVLGSISDHYQYVTKRKMTKRRVAILILEIAMIVVYAAMLVSLFTTAFATQSDPDAMGVGTLLVMFLGMLLLMGVAIGAMVFVYLAYFDLFRSCRPQNEVLFLVLGIVVPITLPFFVFACGNYDLGMPSGQVPQSAARIPEAPAEDGVPEEN